MRADGCQYIGDEAQASRCISLSHHPEDAKTPLGSIRPLPPHPHHRRFGQSKVYRECRATRVGAEDEADSV